MLFDFKKCYFKKKLKNTSIKPQKLYVLGMGETLKFLDAK
jgi:hypothetical protein